jgi:hypothetical protein
MADSSDGIRSKLLDRLNGEADIPVDSPDDYSIRAWLTSAKKCLDQVRHPCPHVIPRITHSQAEEDERGGDLEAAYVNYLKAVNIVAEVIPRHRGKKELDDRKTVQARDYWSFRSVRCPFRSKSC